MVTSSKQPHQSMKQMKEGILTFSVLGLMSTFNVGSCEQGTVLLIPI